MELERSLFLVHSVVLNLFEVRVLTATKRLLLWISACCFVLLVSMHYVWIAHPPGCVKQSMQNAYGGIFINNQTGELEVDDDIILRLVISSQPHNATDAAPWGTYSFSRSEPLIYMDHALQQKTGIRSYNLTLSTQCLGQGVPMFLLSASGAFDTIIINQLMALPDTGGIVKNEDSHELWNWAPQHPNHPPGLSMQVLHWLGCRMQAVVFSLAAFFITSSVIALIARALFTSVPVLLLPVFALLGGSGLHVFQQRSLMLSFPWVGAHLDELLQRGFGMSRFVLCHLCYIVVNLYLFAGAQLLARHTIYNKSIPNSLVDLLWTICFFWEVLALVYVRTKTTLLFFPRAAALAFLTWHLYFFLVPYGFYILALAVPATAVSAMLLDCIQHFEIPALQQGIVSHDNPRQLYMAVLAPAPGFEVPPVWSMFLPLHSGQVIEAYIERNRDLEAAGQ